MRIVEVKLTIAHPEPATQDLESADFESEIHEAVKSYIFENCSVQVDVIRSYSTDEQEEIQNKVGFPDNRRKKLNES